MKKIVVVLLCALFVFSACDYAGDQNQTRDFNLNSSSVTNDDKIATSPDIADKLGKTLAYSFSFIQPPQEFLSELECLEPQEITVLNDNENFLNIHGWILYYVTETSVGPSRMMLTNSSDNKYCIATFNQPIQSIQLSNNYDIVIELADKILYDGYQSEFYQLDILTGLITSIYHEQKFLSTTGYTYFFYNDNLYLETLNDGIYQINSGGGETQLDINHAGFHLFNNKLYYIEFDSGSKILYEYSLADHQKNAIIDLDEIDYIKKVKNDTLIYVTKNDLVVNQLNADSNFVFQQMKDSYIIDVNDEGFYYIDHIGDLVFITYEGEKTVLLSEINTKNVFINNDDIYLIYNTENKTVYVKININESDNIILL